MIGMNGRLTFITLRLCNALSELIVPGTVKMFLTALLTDSKEDITGSSHQLEVGTTMFVKFKY